MVKGANKANIKGQIQVLKAELNNAGSTSHHTSSPIRGPKIMKAVISATH